MPVEDGTSRVVAETWESGTPIVADGDPRLDEIERLGLSGYMHDALARLERSAALETTPSVRARCMRAWLWGHLGGERAARRVHWSEHRRDPTHPSAAYYRAYDLLSERGPVEAWLSMRDYEPPNHCLAVERAEIWSLKARLLAFLGDHRAADVSLAECDAGVFGEPRHVSTRATLLERRERREAARELVQDALSRHPQHRLLTQHLAALLLGEGETEHALELLARADAACQAPALASQRAFVEHELARFDDELASLARCETLAVCADRAHRRELAGRRAENAYRRGDGAAFARLAELSENEYLQGLAERVQGRQGPPDRKQLELKALLQEPMGCAPASLTIVSRYFGAAVDHVDVADQICYEGTASHSERSWVEARGWISREFSVDFATAQALVERGIPFLLVTVDIGSAHAQVVVGFDRTRGSLITRDPMTPQLRELDAEKLFEKHRAYGPRGHVVLPPERAALLDGLELPERDLHDLAHDFRQAMERHDDADARARLAALEARDAQHPLALWARRTLAQRDDDPYAIKACSEALLARFPDDDNAELAVLSCLASIGTEREQEERLARKLATKNPAWVYHERLAQLLGANAERVDEALRSLRRAERRVPTRGRTLALRADLEASAGREALALCLRRAASTLEPTDDDLAGSYFGAAFRRGEAATALSWLEERAERYSVRSGAPACVAFTALEWLDRATEGFELLERALARRPDDGSLLLFAAAAHARYQRPAEARSLLERARGKVTPVQHAQTAARLAELAGDLHEALARHEALLAEQPLALASQSAAASLRSQLFGFDHVRSALARACAAYPGHCGLRELYAGWLRGHDPALVLPELDELLRLQPAHGWARRERALVLSELGRHEQALAEAEAAAQRAPQHPASQRVLAGVLAAAGHRERALAPARRAVELWPDGPGCVSELLALPGSLDEQLELLDWTLRTLLDKSASGEGFLEWYAQASGVVPADDWAVMCRRVLERRPQLWPSSVLAARVLMAEQRPQAITLLEQAIARFPSQPRLYLELADAARAAGDAQRESAALNAALRVDPAWVTGALRAAESIEQSRDPALARATLERGLRFNPRSSALLLALARLAFDHGDPALSLEQARAAVSCEPESGRTWMAYADYARHAERPSDVFELAEELARERPWNGTLWLRLAEVQAFFDENQASIAALRRALQCQPNHFETLDSLAEILTRVRKRDEALAACEKPLNSYFARGALRARRAWVLWQFGERDAACAAMRQVLDEHPDQVWGLQRLTEWEAQRERHAEAAACARLLVQQAPLQPESHGYLGDALLGLDDEQGAWQALSQAARLDPRYAFAGSKRLELALKQRRFDAAEQVLDEQGAHVPPTTRDYWALSLACARRHTTAARDALRNLATRASTRRETLEACAGKLARLPWQELDACLQPLLEDPATQPALGALWVRSRFTAGMATSVRRLRWLRRVHPAAFETALATHFEILGETKASWLRVLGTLAVLGRDARRLDAVWGKAGFALVSARAYVVAELWLSDYRRRPGAEAWMISNSSAASLENYRPGAALAAAEHALSLPTDTALARLMALVAFGRATGGDIAGASELLSGRIWDDLTPRYATLFQAAAHLVQLATCPPEAAQEPLRALRKLDLSPHGLKGMDFGSGGTLQRWLAAGVLRQRFDLRFWLTRWAPLLVLLALGVALFRFPSPDASVNFSVLGLVGLVTLGAWRYKN